MRDKVTISPLALLGGGEGAAVLPSSCTSGEPGGGVRCATDRGVSPLLKKSARGSSQLCLRTIVDEARFRRTRDAALSVIPDWLDFTVS
jgi:hypothetical protein